MIIAHLKETTIAHAPEAISDVISKYTDSESYVFGYKCQIKKLTHKTDLFHFHNIYRNYK